MAGRVGLEPTAEGLSVPSAAVSASVARCRILTICAGQRVPLGPSECRAVSRRVGLYSGNGAQSETTCPSIRQHLCRRQDRPALPAHRRPAAYRLFNNREPGPHSARMRSRECDQVAARAGRGSHRPRRADATIVTTGHRRRTPVLRSLSGTVNTRVTTAPSRSASAMSSRFSDQSIPAHCLGMPTFPDQPRTRPAAGRANGEPD